MHNNPISDFLSGPTDYGPTDAQPDTQPEQSRDIMHDREGFRSADQDNQPVNASTLGEERRHAALQIASTVNGPATDVDALLAAATKVEAWLKGDEVAPRADAVLALGTGSLIDPEPAHGHTGTL